MQATRQTILDYLREHGESGVRVLGEHLDLTSTGVRQHLSILEREGYIASREERRGVGRPTLLYRLTDEGEALYPKAHGALVAAMLVSVRSMLPLDAHGKLAALTAESLAAPHLDALEGMPPADRIEAACEVMRGQAVVVTCESSDEGEYLLRGDTCPFGDLPLEHPLVCEVDAAFVGRLSGMSVEITASRARGDACCTYRLRPLAIQERPV